MSQYNISLWSGSLTQGNLSGDSAYEASIGDITNTPDQIFEEGELNIFSALHWSYRLSPECGGRSSELEAILKWAKNDDDRVLARVVEGKGGAGKTRLAFETALVLEGEGWICRYLNDGEDCATTIPGSAQGFLMIVDYTDERSDWDEIVRFLRAPSKQPAVRTRILILSRQGFFNVREELIQIKDRVGTKPIASLGPLTTDQAQILMEQTIARLSIYGHTQAPSIDFESCRMWLDASADRRMPLYSLAASVHACLEADHSQQSTFDLKRGDIVSALVDREIARINMKSMALGLPRKTLSILLALATEKGGLTFASLSELLKPKNFLMRDHRPDLMLALAETQWWDPERCLLAGVEPDPIGAHFADKVFRSVPADIRASWQAQIFERAA